MKTFKQHIDERCWPGYKPVSGKTAYSKGSCVKEEIDEAVNEKQIRKDLDAGMSHDAVIGKHANKKVSNTVEIRKVIQKHAWDKRMKKEEVELDEVRLGGLARTKNTIHTDPKDGIDKIYGSHKVTGKHLSRDAANKFNQSIIRSNMPQVMSNLKKQGIKIKEEVELDEMDKSQPYSSRGAEGLPLGKKAEPVKTDKVKSDALKVLQKQYKKVKEEVEEIDEVAAWQRKEGKNPEGGLNQKGVESYRRENPGSKLQTAVTTKPSKLKPGSKAANRRKSFCSRMGGLKRKLTSSKTANDPNSRVNKALRKWNC